MSRRGKGSAFQASRESNGFSRFNNPSMTPSVKLVDPAWDTEIQRKLEEFQQDTSKTHLMFPTSFTNVQRKRIHELAQRYGLSSNSQGREPHRKCVVRHRKINLMASVSASETNPITLTPTMRTAIRDFMHQFPIEEYDIDRHNSVNSSQTTRSRQRYDTQRNAQPLVPPVVHNPAFRAQREQLPACAKRNEILATIHRHQVTLVTGGTGCGKTTQIPQFLLEESAAQNKPLKIICTQPRRLPAIAVAERVAKERNEPLGQTIGYHIRLEQKTSERTVLTYCTSGVLLRMLTQEDSVRNMTHIILDEIHEREQNTDYLLIALKQALRKDSKIKIILMSATMEGNLEMFKRYFDVPVHHIDIPSRLYNVEKFFLGDVIAMTGYAPPESIFSSGSFGYGAFGATSSSFPTMSHWNKEENSGGVFMNSGRNSFGVPQQPPAHQSVPVREELFNNVAQQLATSQASATHQQYQYQMPDNYSQPGMHHSATWTGGMDKGGGAMPDVVNMTCTPEDIQHFQQGFADVPQYMDGSWQSGYEWQQQPYTGHQMHNSMTPMHNNGMQYFPQPMDGTVGYDPSPPHRSASQSMLASNTSGRSQFASTDNSFGAALQREHHENMTKRHRLLNALPNRPSSFEPHMKQMLRSQLPSTADLASLYMELGGHQHQDGVDTELITSVIKYCMESSVLGAILVFLPGYEDINDVKDKVNAQCIGMRLKPQIFTLHSQMNSADQQRVFEPAEHGHRKVILSTNIAEASLTIDDVVFVIDTGKVKEKTFDHNSRISQLKVTPIAKSNAEQRSGRAGRCREGFCFRLYSFADYERMLPTQMAEMQRSAIHDVCLHAKMFAPDNMTVRQFLEMAPEPPLASAIDSSMAFLEQLGALYSEASTSDIERENRGFSGMTYKEPELTHLGRLIAQLPLEPQLARLLLFGLALKCLSSAVTLVAALSHRDPFLLPMSEDRDRANASRDRFGQLDYSDHLSLLRAINEFETKTHRECSMFCRTNFVSLPGLRMIVGIRRQLLCEMKRNHLIEYDGDPNNALHDPKYNQYSGCWPIIQVAIVAGCYPGIGFTKSGSKMRKIRTTSEKNSTLHPSSIIKRQLMATTKINGPNGGPQVEFLAFQEFTKLDEGLTLRTVTAVPPLAIVLAAGGLHLKQSHAKDFNIASYSDDEEEDEPMEEEDVSPHFGSRCPPQQIFELEHWICLRGTPSTMRDAVRLRFKLMSYFLQVMADPKLLRNETMEHKCLLETLSVVLSEDHNKVGFHEVKNIAPQPRVNHYGYNNWNNRHQAPQQNSAQNQEQQYQYNEGRRNGNSQQSFNQFPSRPQPPPAPREEERVVEQPAPPPAPAPRNNHNSNNGGTAPSVDHPRYCLSGYEDRTHYRNGAEIPREFQKEMPSFRSGRGGGSQQHEQRAQQQNNRQDSFGNNNGREGYQKNYHENQKNYQENQKNYQENQKNHHENQKNYQENQKNYQENQKNHHENQKNYQEKEGGSRDYDNRSQRKTNSSFRVNKPGGGNFQFHHDSDLKPVPDQPMKGSRFSVDRGSTSHTENRPPPPQQQQQHQRASGDVRHEQGRREKYSYGFGPWNNSKEPSSSSYDKQNDRGNYGASSKFGRSNRNGFPSRDFNTNNRDHSNKEFNKEYSNKEFTKEYNNSKKFTNKEFHSRQDSFPGTSQGSRFNGSEKTADSVPERRGFAGVGGPRGFGPAFEQKHNRKNHAFSQQSNEPIPEDPMPESGENGFERHASHGGAKKGFYSKFHNKRNGDDYGGSSGGSKMVFTNSSFKSGGGAPKSSGFSSNRH